VCLLRDRPQHVSRLGNVRQVELGTDSFRLTCSLASISRSCLRLFLPLEVGAHFDRFIRFNRARVGFLFGDPERWKDFEDFLALDFQFPGQIVDSNLLLHPSFVSPNFR
jgi:hypothetical protein